MKLPVTLSDNAHGGLGVIYRTDNGELALRPHNHRPPSKQRNFHR
jgi:hypothetical protein